jgi:predicted Rdx family selenoprotein
MANEFYRYFGAEAGISLTPGANGRLEVYLDGEKIFDRSEEDGKYPDLTRVKQLRDVIQAKLDSVEVAAA